MDSQHARWHRMEETLLGIRRLWFGSEVRPLAGGLLVVEHEGALLMEVDADPRAADALIAEARRQRAHVVITPMSRPPDLHLRLVRAGFAEVQQQGTYLFHPDRAPVRGHRPVMRPGWWARLLAAVGGGPDPAAAPQVALVGQADLPVWNEVFFQAFRPRGHSVRQSLAEKERAWLNMGPAANWYLALAAGRPAGTCILYRGAQVGQILAVGTAPGFRRRGIATALVQRAVADWQAEGSGFLFLDTGPGTPAERLYLALGFEPAYIRRIYSP